MRVVSTDLSRPSPSKQLGAEIFDIGFYELPSSEDSECRTVDSSASE